MLATIPDALPPEYAGELAQLQANAPPMGWPFVRRRMAAELGPDWQSRFAELRARRRGAPPRSARSIAPTAPDGRDARLQAAISRHGIGGGGRPRPAQARDRRLYERYDRVDQPRPRSTPRSPTACARSSTTRARPGTCGLYRRHAAPARRASTCRSRARALDQPPAHHDLARGRAAARHRPSAPQEERNRVALNMFRAWYVPFYGYGVIHGDPHLGNYTVRARPRRQPARFRLHPHLPAALRQGRHRPLPRAAARRPRRSPSTPTRPGASATLEREIIDVLNRWARFVYGPLLDDRRG